MSDFVYRVRDDELMHAVAKYSYSSRASLSTNTKKSSVANDASLRKSAKNQNYKSPYYDPVARHERYLRERKSLGIKKGTWSVDSQTSSGKGSSSGRGSSGSGKAKKGSSKGRGAGRKNISAAIQKLREESATNTEAQREAARRKVDDLRNELRQQVEKLRDLSDDNNESLNASEIKGNIQQIKDKIQQAGGDLNKWITTEKDSLERRIAALYKANGQKYKVATQADKQKQSKAKEKEIKSRADSIYKSKSKK